MTQVIRWFFYAADFFIIIRIEIDDSHQLIRMANALNVATSNILLIGTAGGSRVLTMDEEQGP